MITFDDMARDHFQKIIMPPTLFVPQKKKDKNSPAYKKWTGKLSFGSTRYACSTPEGKAALDASNSKKNRRLSDASASAAVCENVNKKRKLDRDAALGCQ